MGQPRIVVGIDSSPASRAALRWAADEAAATGGRLYVAHCQSDVSADMVKGIGESFRTAPAGILENAVTVARTSHPTLAVEGAVLLDRPAVALIRASEAADLIVVGTHGHSRIEAVMLGSTSLEVLSRATCPTVVVPPAPAAVPARFAGHVVVGVDGSEESRCALEFALAEAERRHYPLAAVFVEDDNSADTYFDRDLLQTFVEYAQPGREFLARMVEPLALHFPGVHVKEVLIPDRPLAGLIRVSAGAHLLVIGTHTHHVLTGAVTGSMALALAGHAECPVAVVHRAAVRSGRTHLTARHGHVTESTGPCSIS